MYVQRSEQGPYQTAAGLPLCANRQGLTWTFTLPRSAYCLLTQRSQSRGDDTLCSPFRTQVTDTEATLKNGDFVSLPLSPNIFSSDYFLSLLHSPFHFPSLLLSPFSSYVFSFLFVSSCPHHLFLQPPYLLFLQYFIYFLFLPLISLLLAFFLVRSSYPCLFLIPLSYSPFLISLF